jgi:hypothetical protein
MSQAGVDGVRRIAAEAGELMLNSPAPIEKRALGAGFSPYPKRDALDLADVFPK